MTIKDFIDNYSNVTGVGNNVCNSLKYINQARQLVYVLGDFTGTLEWGSIRKNEACVFLPWNLETVRMAWDCYQNINIDNSLFCQISQQSYCRNRGESITLVKTDRKLSYPFIFGSSEYLMAFKPCDSRDDGQEIVVTYTNAFGSSYTETITLKRETYTFINNAVNVILAIEKPSCSGIVEASLFNLMKGRAFRHFIYPQEINPKYDQYSLSSPNCRCVIIQAKKRLIPYTENDLTQDIDINPHGLTLALKAIKAMESDAEDAIDKYSKFVKLAGLFLKKETDDQRFNLSPNKVVQTSPVITASTTGRYDYE